MLFLIVKKRNQSINQHKARAHLAWTNSPQRWMLVGGCVSYLLTLEMTSKLVGVADRATMNGYKARLELMLAHTIAHMRHARTTHGRSHARTGTHERAPYTRPVHQYQRTDAQARTPRSARALVFLCSLGIRPDGWVWVKVGGGGSVGRRSCGGRGGGEARQYYLIHNTY